MNGFKTIMAAMLVVAAMIAGAAEASAQQARRSPMDAAGRVIDENRITIYYSRPYTIDSRTSETRKIWGGLVPYDQVWRTGANEATLLVTQKPLLFGDVEVPAGAHSIYSIPSETGESLLIINKQIGQPGTTYDEKLDVVRIPMKKEAIEGDPVMQFTMAVDRNEGGGGVIKLRWEKTQFSVPFKVKQ